MPKNIVFCADGTWNGPGDLIDAAISESTNVFKLFLNLAGKDDPDDLKKKDEQERSLVDQNGQKTQIAKYLHGVGDSDNPFVKVMGGTFGAGLATRIIRGYTFISRNYEPGDSIFLTGFSRGAYTARTLAGLICAKGLLDARTLDLTDKDAAYRLGAAVWYQFSHEKCQAAEQKGADWLERLEHRIMDMPRFVSIAPTQKRIAVPSLTAVGVWDTVGSLGIPDFINNDHVTDVFQFADTTLNPKVQRGIHAIALDEQRNTFVPTLWDADPRITQMLFPGAHSDVGGGYPETGLSNFVLAWMQGKLVEVGLILSDPLEIVPNFNSEESAHQPWAHFPWVALGYAQRIFVPADKLEVSKAITQRIQGDPVKPDPSQPATPYNPANLPAA